MQTTGLKVAVLPPTAPEIVDQLQKEVDRILTNPQGFKVVCASTTHGGVNVVMLELRPVRRLESVLTPSLRKHLEVGLAEPFRFFADDVNCNRFATNGSLLTS